MSYQLAQLNIAAMKEAIDSPLLADFVANLDRINQLAESSPGFVWRLQDESGDATSLRHFGENRLVNMSVWADVDSLRGFVFKSMHAEILRRRKEWFDRVEEAYQVLWWVPEGHIPSLEEAAERLFLLRESGTSANAFSFRESFPPPAS